MPVFVSSTSVATRPGVYAIEESPPALIQATGTAIAAIVEQFPWGPAQKLTSPGSFREFLDTFAPAGFVRTGSGYLAVIKKAFPQLKVVRVIDPAAVQAFATVTKAGPTNMLTLTAKYPGTAGNSLSATVSAASDGDANHFNLTVSISSATGVTTDLIQNLNYSGTGADSVPDLTSALLLGSITKLASGVPTPGTYTFASGTDGTIDATTYVGTAGAPDKGISLLENDKTIDAFFVGDPGNSIRATVNAGGKAHADLMTDRVFYMNGNSGQSASAAVTDVASYRSLRVVYVDPWVKITDDTTGAIQLVPSAPFAASVACQLSPSTDIGWRDDKVIAMLDGIVDVEADRGSNAAANTAAGITTVIKAVGGGFAFELGVVTIAPTNPAKMLLTRTRMGHYIARSEVNSLQSKVNSPNVAFNWNDEILAIQTFLNTLIKNGVSDPNNSPFIVAGAIVNLKTANSSGSIAAGEFHIPQSIQTAATQEKIFLELNYGPNVTVNTGL